MAENWKNKGNQEYQAGNYGQAVEYYTYAVEMEPKNHIYVTNRSTAYAAMKQWEKSLKDADKAIALKGDWAKGFFRKGIALFELGRFQESAQAFKKACALDPENAEVQKRYEEANRLWKKDLSAAELQKEEGNECFKVGKIDDAIKHYTRALSLCEDNEKDKKTKSDIYNNRAACYVQLYEPTKVVADCNESLALFPGNIKALLRRGFAYESLDKMRMALDDFQTVLSMDPSVSQANQAVHRIKSALKASGKNID
jgi:stress-induced-phosphoprotein 1